MAKRGPPAGKGASCPACDGVRAPDAMVCAACVERLERNVVGRRLGAWAIDMALLLVPFAGLVACWMFVLHPLAGRLCLALGVLHLALACGLVYRLILRDGTTPGMSLRGLAICDAEGRRARALPALQVAFPGKAARRLQLVGKLAKIAPACVIALRRPLPRYGRIGLVALAALSAIGFTTGLWKLRPSIGDYRRTAGSGNPWVKDLRRAALQGFTAEDFLAEAEGADDDTRRWLLERAVEQAQPALHAALRDAALHLEEPAPVLGRLVTAGDTASLGLLFDRLSVPQSRAACLEELRRLARAEPLDAHALAAFARAEGDRAQLGVDLAGLVRDRRAFHLALGDWYLAQLARSDDADVRERALHALVAEADSEGWSALFSVLRAEDAQRCAAPVADSLARLPAAQLETLVSEQLRAARTTWPLEAALRLVWAADGRDTVRGWLRALLASEVERERHRGLALAGALRRPLLAAAEGADRLRWAGLIAALRPEAEELAAALEAATRESGIAGSLDIVRRMLASDDASQQAHAVRMLEALPREDLLTWAALGPRGEVDAALEALRRLSDDALAQRLREELEAARAQK